MSTKLCFWDSNRIDHLIASRDCHVLSEGYGYRLVAADGIPAYIYHFKDSGNCYHYDGQFIEDMLNGKKVKGYLDVEIEVKPPFARDMNLDYYKD